jgi:hypothetical protein
MPEPSNASSHHRTGRRSLLRLAGATAAGGAASALAGSHTAVAATGNVVYSGGENYATRRTEFVYGTKANDSDGGASLGSSDAMVLISANASNSDEQTGLWVFAPGLGIAISASPAIDATGGIVARGSAANSNAAFVGKLGQYGLIATENSKANLLLTPERNGPDPVKIDPPQRTDSHVIGEIDNVKGTLWACVSAGTPGRWRILTGPSTTGALHSVTPGRVYDSRLPEPFAGPLSSGATRDISVGARRNLETGAVVESDFVPSGAQVVAINITVVATAGPGFVTVNPGGVPTVNASNVNWNSAGQVVANSAIVTLGPGRQLTLIVGGGGQADIIIDVTGYWR